MSRSPHPRQQQKLQQHQQLLAQQQQMADNESAAAAAEMFDLFCVATTMRQILGLHRNMCDLVGMRPAPLNEFYPKLKAKIRSWKAQALWKKFDARASHRVYAKGNACTGTRVLVIGAGPCGLRTAIEAQLLGAKVVVVEKRDRISRNNVLHLWPFVITDLRNLGAKKFYGKFCAGSIDHISIRQLQCILLKVALLLGVEIHEGVSFDSTVEPTGDDCGWHAAVTPADHAVSHYEFDVLIGADGKRNTLEGFRRKEFRGKLAIAITANFINKKTEAEAKAEEISGVAFIFNQSFFKELYHTTGIDLENIVYYKDETHYFVMTAKKHSLIDKGVIMQDFADPAELLAPANVNTEKLLDYAREAAEFSTKYQMPNLEFAVNHYGKPDVAMFDFTSMFAAETSCRVIYRKGFRLLQCLVGDSLLEPFWPTGSGCARGFLSSMDAAYAIKLWTNTRNSTLGVLAQRESIYRLLNQTTPENLQRDIGSYTVDPATRYPNLNRTSVNVWQVKHLIDTDDKAILEQTFMDTNALQTTQVDTPVRRKRRSGDSMPLSAVLLRWICAQLHAYEFTASLKEVTDVFTNGKVLCALINRYRPDLVDFNAVKDLSAVECNDIAFKILEKELHIPRVMSGKDSIQLNAVDSKIWLNYLEQICEVFRGEIPHVKHPKMDFTELREKYRINYVHAQPDFSKLLQISSKQKASSPMQDMVDVPQTVQRRSVLDEEKLKRQRKLEQLAGTGGNGENAQNPAPSQAQVDTPRRAKKRRNADKTANIDRDRGDIPSALPRGATDEQFSDRIKSMEQRITSRNNYGTDKKPKDLMRAIGKIDSNDWNVREIEKKIEQSKKTEIHGPKGREKVPKWSKEQFQARQNKMAKPVRQDSTEEKFKEIDQTLKNLDKQLKEGSVLEIGERGRNKVASIAGQFVKKDDNTSDEKNPPTVVPKSSSKVALAFKKQAASEKCHFCKQTVYLMEKITTEGLILHRSCLKCHHCHTNLRPGGYAFDRDDPNGRFYCTQHFRLPAKAIRPVVRKGQRKTSQQAQATTVAKGNEVETAAEPQTPDKLRGHADNVAQLDLLDRGQTPERIEFENTDAMSDGEPSEEHIIDEHEWSGRNFLPESNNDSESDLSSSDESDSDSDSDMFEEANDSPLGAQTLQLATDWIGKQNYTDSDDSDDFYDSSEGIADDGKDDTEGEEFKKARELRREEVRLLPLPANLPTDTETEVQSESESSSPDEVELNSATEISTDSEFDHDEIAREAPKIFIDDTHLRKQPTKVQIKSTVLPATDNQKHNSHTNSHAQNRGSYLQKYQKPPQPQFKPLVQVDPSLLNTTRTPLQNPRAGDYLLNKTASTEGIASKKSLELKKRYLLGEQGNGNKIQKSGSTSVLDSKIRSFQSNISECQKLLNPGSDISPSMKTFLNRTKPGSNGNNSDLMRSATSNILNDLKVEITIQKASSTASTDNEKENLFVNSKNELNKGMEYSETVNTTLLETINKKSPSTPTNTNNQKNIIETIDLVTPEKPMPIIDLNKVEIPTKMLQSNVEFINNVMSDQEHAKPVTPNDNTKLLTADSNKIIDLTGDSPVKSEKTIIAETKPDVSKDAKERIPDILGHIEKRSMTVEQRAVEEEDQHLLSNSCEDEAEKRDSPEKLEEHFENDTVQIQVPNIPWTKRKTERMSTSSGSSCTSNSSSVEDIQHYILDSTTSPDTNNSGLTGSHQVPRLEIHDTSGALMQVDNLLLIDGNYVAPEIGARSDALPEVPAIKTTELEDDHELDGEPVTATPEPAECTVIEAEEQPLPLPASPPPPVPPQSPPALPEKEAPSMKPANLRFDTRNENKIESLKNLPLIVEQSVEHTRAIKPVTLNLGNSTQSRQSPGTPPTPTALGMRTPTSPLVDNDKTPTADLLSRGSDSETEPTNTAQALTETELSDWTADDCISENFVDMEFVLNSNKGTIKRNKKDKKRLHAAKLPSTNEALYETCKPAPVTLVAVAPMAELEGILKAIDIDDIEFMDTGSEGSCAETYSATNTALLRNRGYIEFIETTPQATPSHKSASACALGIPNGKSNGHGNYDKCKRDEKLGIDYIEQGAYIMQDRDNAHHDALKTPVNEPTAGVFSAQSQSANTMTQSLTDSSTLNDLDDDSLGIVTPNTKTTTTEESEALTVVTSPLDSSSPRTNEHGAVAMQLASKVSSETSSSFEKNPKTSLSTCTPSSNTTSTTSSNKGTPPKRNSQHEANASEVAASAQRKLSDEISYEEYVRALQQKITQISTAHSDSLDTRKQRRKSSKGDAQPPIAAAAAATTAAAAAAAGATNQATVIEETTSKLQVGSTRSDNDMHPSPNVSAVAAGTSIHKVPEIPTLTRKLEEITKERTKQKDLIHDLVMDKLQSKKQLNAEKRLHRSRQRTLLTSGYNSGSSLSPTPQLAAATTISDTNCTSKAHYHVSTAAPAPESERSQHHHHHHNHATHRPLTAVSSSTSSSSFKENKNPPLQKSATYVSPYCVNAAPLSTSIRAAAYAKQRPFSEHLDSEQLDALERYKLSKTVSCAFPHTPAATKQSPTTDGCTHATYGFAAPSIPLRQHRARNGVGEEKMSASTENLRSEARARARMKSNSELGLSPEEKMQLLRKRLHADYTKGKANSAGDNSHAYATALDLDARARKMSASKSVNDIAAYVAYQQPDCTPDENSNTHATAADFTSDPNLLLSSSNAHTDVQCKVLKHKTSRRQKDPERRKSLIQSLSNFFHKGSSSATAAQAASHSGKDKRELGDVAAHAGHSAHAERPGTSGSSTTNHSGSTDGVFSRFRISPKSKEKSKDKDGYANNAISVATSVRPTTTTPRTTTTTTSSTSTPAGKTKQLTAHERSNSQDCILHSKATNSHYSRHSNNYNYNNSNNNNHNNSHSHSHSQHTNNHIIHGKKSSTSTFSSSSPQLFVHKPHCPTTTADEPPPIPPLPLNYQRSDDESYATETREQKKQRAISKAVRQAELKRLRIAQEIQREQEEIEVQLKELEARGVLIEKALRGEAQIVDNNLDTTNNIGSSDERLLKELLEIWRNITQLKKRDEELGIRQQELQLEHRHAQLKEELNLRLSCNKLDKSSADVAAEGAILNEMLEIVAKRAALRPTTSNLDLATTSNAATAGLPTESVTFKARGHSLDNEESNI